MTSASSAIPLYLESLRHAKKSPRTIRTYAFALDRFSKIIGENDELSEENYKKFLYTVAEETDRAQITYRSAVARLYQYHAPGVPVKALTEQYGIKQNKSMIRYNEDGLEKFLQFAEKLRGDLSDLRDRAFILTLADTGLRIAEACSLKRGDIDFDRARAVIIGKGDKPGVVRFSPRSLQSIRDYLAARAELDGKSGRPLFSLPVFARHDRGAGKKVKPVTSGGMWHALDLRKREAGITEEDESERGPITPHKWRHRFVTLILRETGNIATAKELARHEDINTTQRYGHLAEEELDETYKGIFDE